MLEGKLEVHSETLSGLFTANVISCNQRNTVSIEAKKLRQVNRLNVIITEFFYVFIHINVMLKRKQK